MHTSEKKTQGNITHLYGKPWIKRFVLGTGVSNPMFDVDLVVFTDNTVFYVDKHLPLRHYSIFPELGAALRGCNTAKEANEAFVKFYRGWKVEGIIWNTGYFIEKL